jgi:metallopeptidase MepB
MNKEKGRRYREMVLRKGGSQPAMKTLVEFLGRQPKPEAFYEWMGISGQ